MAKGFPLRKKEIHRVLHEHLAETFEFEAFCRIGLLAGRSGLQGSVDK
jgi:hypothetical protein